MEINNPNPERELSSRQSEIFRILVQEYISTANPVGSGTIQKIGGMEISSATIRNELASLEEMGFLTQPHTSAGRIPTVQGYRYYVERLMQHVDLPAIERHMIRHQFHQIRLDLEQWMRLTAAILAHKAQSASLVTPPHAVNSRFKYLEIVSIRDTLCLMILVLHDSSVYQKMLSLNEPKSQDDLKKISNKLNELLKNRSVRDIRNSTNPELTGLQGLEAEVFEHVLMQMRQADQRLFRNIYQDGLVNVLHQPEFVEPAKFRQLVELLEQRDYLETVLSRILNANGVQIIIGSEGLHEDILDISLVLSPYGIKGKASGVLGIMGPTRMQYSRVISTVQYIAQLMDGLIADMYNTGSL
ncbi:MAG: heat-inducible transcription repressor HrcA [Chloroflexi bacterium]|nr:heat-inducible transcription repressor HrcA [Chloroflexota bacterium]